MSKEKDMAKAYRNLSYIASMEASRLSMLKRKLESERKLMLAMASYYDELEELHLDNINFGFDLNLR